MPTRAARRPRKVVEMVEEEDDMTVAFCVICCDVVPMRSLLETAVALLLSSAVN